MVAFILIIAAAVSLDDLNHDNYDKLDAIGALNNFDWEWEDTTSLARSACGFLVFLALVVLLVEGLITAQRFLNFRIMDNFIILFHIAVGQHMQKVCTTCNQAHYNCVYK